MTNGIEVQQVVMLKAEKHLARVIGIDDHTESLMAAKSLKASYRAILVSL